MWRAAYVANRSASGTAATSSSVSGRRLATVGGHTDRVRAVGFAPDDKSLATASSDGKVRLWKATRGARRKVLHGHTDTVHAVAFSADGNT